MVEIEESYVKSSIHYGVKKVLSIDDNSNKVGLGKHN
jgi:hypothetical protein